MTLLSRKVCLLGDFAVGKTSAMVRGVRDAHVRDYLTTVGARVDSKPVRLEGRSSVRMVLWDIPGSSTLDRARCNYLTDAHGLLLVADGTRPETITDALALRRQAEDAVGRPLPCVLLLNKCDMASHWDVSPGMLEELTAQLSVFVVSARTGQRIEEAFRDLAEKLAS